MDKDLLLIRSVRDNKELASIYAEKKIADREIDGVVFVFNLLDIRTNPSDVPPYALDYRTVHTEAYSLGNCASQGCQKQLLHRISDYHKQCISGKRPVVSGSTSDREMATKRIAIAVDSGHTLDAILVVWGSDAEHNQELLRIFAEGL